MLNNSDINFFEKGFHEINLGGTPMIFAVIGFDNAANLEKDFISEKLIEYIRNKYPNLKVSESSFDYSNFYNNEIRFVISNPKTINSKTNFNIIYADKKIDKEKVDKAVNEIEKLVDEDEFKKANDSVDLVLSSGFFTKDEVSTIRKHLNRFLQDKNCRLDSLN